MNTLSCLGSKRPVHLRKNKNIFLNKCQNIVHSEHHHPRVNDVLIFKITFSEQSKEVSFSSGSPVKSVKHHLTPVWFSSPIQVIYFPFKSFKTNIFTVRIKNHPDPEC